MELNQICLSLLELLFQNDGICSFSHIHDTFHLSKRSLQYQIDKLNIFLHYHQLPEIQYTSCLLYTSSGFSTQIGSHVNTSRNASKASRSVSGFSSLESIASKA